MSQTLLATLALVVVGMFALSQLESIAHTRHGIIVSEIMMQATAVATDRIEEIGSLTFDENIAKAGGAKLTMPSQLTAGPPFTADGVLNDIDDFHSVEVDTFRVSSSEEDTLWFRVQSYVTYADETQLDMPVTGPSKVKKVTVKVHSLDLVQPDTIEISQAFTCGSRCGW